MPVPEPQMEIGTSILQKNSNEHIPEHGGAGEMSAPSDLTTGHSTKRIIRQSAGSETNPIATVIEENEEEDKGEGVVEDTTTMETPIAPRKIEYDGFTTAVADPLSTSGEKELVEAISITTDESEHTEANSEESTELQNDSTQEQATSETVSEPAETSDVKEVETVTELAEAIDTGADAKDVEDVTQSTGD